MQSEPNRNSRLEDAKIVSRLLWKAFLALLTFEFQEMMLCLRIAWIHIRYEHDTVNTDEGPE